MCKLTSSQIGIGLVLMLGFIMPTQASFDIFPEDAEGYYGRAQKKIFVDSVEGTDVLSNQDRAFLNSVQSTRVTERWYVRALITKAKTKLQDLSNNSSPNYQGLPLTLTNQTNNLYQVLVAGGYLWESWALEGELFFSKRMKVDMNPVFATAPTAPNMNVNMSSKLDQIGLLFNVQYIIPRWFDFYPQRLQLHLDAGVGPDLKMTDSTTTSLAGTPRVSGSSRNIAVMAKFGAGMRYQVTTHILVDIAYNYLWLGKTDFGPVDGIKFKSNEMRSNGFYIGATYQV